VSRQERGQGPVVAPQDLEFRPLRARGPGGQNVNKVASAVQLRFDLESSQTLSAAVKTRLRRLAGRRLTAEGVIVISADTHRTQIANRHEALARLEALIERARIEPKTRIATRATGASRRRRLEHKRRHQGTKAMRRAPNAED
jgi:ribosome-associated protein